MFARVKRTTEDFRRGQWVVVVKDYGDTCLVQDEDRVAVIDKLELEDFEDGSEER